MKKITLSEWRLIKNGRPLLGIIIPLLIFTFFIYQCFFCTVDDAFISPRYAQNLVDGKGLVFNANEKVEGFSHPLWTLLLVLPAYLSCNVILFAKIIGVISWIAILAVSQHILRRHFTAPAGIVALLGTFIATSIALIYYSIAGLETIFYAMQIVLMNYLLLEKRPLAASIVAAFIAVSRPEGVLYILPLAAWLVVNRTRWRTWYFYLIIPGLMTFLLLLVRWIYYHAILPNTFYVKVHTQGSLFAFISTQTLILIKYTFTSFCPGDLMLFFAILYLVLFNRKKYIAMTLSIVMAAFFIWVSSLDWMPFGRFYVPVMPLLAIFSFAAVHETIFSLVRGGKRTWLVYLCLLIPIVFNAINTHYQIKELIAGDRVNPALNSRGHIEIGKYLRDNATPGEKAVTNEIGAIGYYSRLNVVDMIGLTDKKIPQFLKKNELHKYAAYILAQKPKYILLNDRQEPWDREMHPYHKAIFDGMQSLGIYHLRKEFPLNSWKNVLLFEYLSDND